MTNMNVLEVHLLGLGIGMFFSSKLYLLEFLLKIVINQSHMQYIFISFHPYGYKWTLPI